MSGLDTIALIVMGIGLVLGVLLPIGLELKGIGEKPAHDIAEATNVARKGLPRRRRELTIMMTANALVLSGAIIGGIFCLTELTDGENEFNFVTRQSHDDPYFLGAMACLVLFFLAAYIMWVLTNKVRAAEEAAKKSE